ncbi:MAG: DNA topoisomerase VI [Bdellovibrionaceae bacterium]|nr:DNA topoisomerase VI [Pseudobdellovibrionaceae bacterium]
MAKLKSVFKMNHAQKDVGKLAYALCDTMLKDLEKAKRPTLEAIKCSLDNAIYSAKVGFFTPGEKRVRTELNVSSVQKMARSIFLLDIFLENLKAGGVNTKREVYYRAKGWIKKDPELRPIDFEGQEESDSIISFLCDALEIYREELNCVANDRGGQTYSQQLIVTEHMPDGTKAKIDLGSMGTTPFQPKNRPQSFTLSMKSKIKFCLVVESEGTANTLVTNGITKRNKCIVVGAQGVPSNGVRGWVKTIQDQLKIPVYFFGDLDAYTLQNIYRTLKSGSAASLIRNKNFCAPDVKFLGVLPEDVKKYDLDCYSVKEKDASEARSLKKARDALQNDPFFKDAKNKKLAQVLKWLLKNKIRCEQQALFSVDPKDITVPEKIILDKIKNKIYI